MRSFVELAVAPALSWKKWRGDFLRWSSADRGNTLSRRAQDHNDVTWTSTLLGLKRFITLMIEEAVSVFDQARFSENISSGNGNTAPGAVEAACNKPDPVTLCTHLSWAVWVIQTFLELERIYLDAPLPIHEYKPEALSAERLNSSLSNFSSIDDENEADNPAKAIISSMASARSPKTFASVLRFAIGGNFAAALHISAYAVCSDVLELSRITTPAIASKKITGEILTSTHCDKYDVEQLIVLEEERALARTFTARLQSEANSGRLASPLLQSQLELLVQFQIGHSTAHRNGGESNHSARLVFTEGRGPGERYTGQGQDASSNDSWDSCRKYIESWDVATNALAGIEGGIDTSDMVQTKQARRLEPHGLSSAESGGLALSNAAMSPLTGNHTSDYREALFVESARATSITLSWGGWVGTNQAPELQVGADSDGLTCPLSFNDAIGASNLTQALQSKLRLVVGRRRENHRRSLVLKVRAGGLWGWESFHTLALDLDSVGRIKVYGLKADTLYCFRLECPAPPCSPSKMSTPEVEETSDNERSCFPPAATNDAVSPTRGDDTRDGEPGAFMSVDESHENGGEASACSKCFSAAYTVEDRRYERVCSVSSTRASTGPHVFNSGVETCDNAQTGDGEDWEFQHRSSGISESSTSADREIEFGATHEQGIVACVSVATPPEVPFMLDTEGCGPNLRLSNSNLTVKNCGRKKWSAVRATRAFRSGIHRWKIHVNRCVSKNVFIGVVSAESRLNNYVGSDRAGWGYLANKAIWHNKGKVRSYGDLFKEGDTIGVSLNMDLGTLQFSRNGHDLGVAVQGLEGVLYPAVSLYNRNDQLTLEPPEDSTTSNPTSSSIRNEGNQNSIGLSKCGADAEHFPWNSLHGTFSAECLVRRAAKVFEVLGVLTKEGGFDFPAGYNLVDSTRYSLIRWSKGTLGRSVVPPSGCTPVRVDTSEEARHQFFGLGTGDRIFSAGGEATVLGATRHSLWISLEAPLSSPASSPAVGRRSWGCDSEMANKDRDDVNVYGRDHASDSQEDLTMSSPLHPSISDGRNTKTTTWFRSNVRHIVSHPEDYVISRGPTPVDSTTLPTSNINHDRDLSSQHEIEVAPFISENLSNDEVRRALLAWTPGMDEELVSRLNIMTETLGLASPLELPFDVLEDLPSCAVMFPLTTSINITKVRTRASLLLYVNDLVIPILRHIDASRSGRGAVGALVRKCRHLIFKRAKLVLLGIKTWPSLAALSLAIATENTPGLIIALHGIKSLPTAPTIHMLDGAESQRKSSWVERSRAVENSVFGQVSRELTRSSPQISDGMMAFSVKLSDAPQFAKDKNQRDLYCGVLWQVCSEVCSQPISMFILPPNQESGTSDTTASGANRAAVDNNSDYDYMARTKALSQKSGAVPNPLFVSNWESPPVSMDPRRIISYRSLGFLAGLAIRTRVPFPLPHLNPIWWILVANGSDYFDGDLTSERATPRTHEQDEGTSYGRSNAPDEATAMSSVDEGDSSVSRQEGMSSLTIDGILVALDRVGANQNAQEALEDILKDARFVGPLSNEYAKEPTPGGVGHSVAQDSISKYRARLASLRYSEYAPQTAAFRTGLEDALPGVALSLLTWREMEGLVCGGGHDGWTTGEHV